MNIKLRSATDADFEQLIDLFKEFALFEKLPEKMINSVDKMIAEKDFFNCFVAETDDQKIIGYVTYFFCYYTWVGKSMYMDDLYVRPEYRGKGIGKKLITKVISYASETECNKLRWQVSNWNKPAIDFYKSLGAIIENVEQNCDLILKQ